MGIQKLGQTALQAIKCLKSSGDMGFERLTAILLSRLIGTPIRLCRAGYQGGVDAAGEIPIAIEDKRYQKGRLDLRKLEGGLAAAARVYPDLQLWVLVTTVPVDVYSQAGLRETGENLGLAVLFLDSAAAEPDLPDIPSIVALCAIDPDETLQAIRSPDWLDSRRAAKMPPIASVEADLKAVRSISGFTRWVDRMRMELTEQLPLWQLVIQRQNQRLKKILEEDALHILGTAFDPKKLVSRSAKKAIDKWFAKEIAASDPEIAVVAGERFDGKTWCVFSWLEDHLESLSMPVFFIGSKRGMNSTKGLRDHILDEVRGVLGPFGRHAEAIVHRHSNTMVASTPWCLIVLDGMNEYGLSQQKCFEHLASARGLTELNSRPCAVLATVRQRSWDELASQVKGNVRLIEVGMYDDTEFQAAIELRGLSIDCLHSLPEAAQHMVRRPRYFGLVIDHMDKLDHYGAITANILHWLDACDKIARRSAPIAGWDEEHYQELLKELASRHISQGSLKLHEIHTIIQTLTSDHSAILDDLKSEGVLIKTAAGYDVSHERLALGMGLYILEQLSAVHERQGDIVESLRDLLAPSQETEEVISWVRAATTVAVLSDPPTPEKVAEALVNEWLRARNLMSDDYQDIKALRGCLLPPLLRLAAITWSIEREDERLQEISQRIFTDGLTSHKELLGDAVRTWFRLVPTAGSTFFQHKKEDAETAIRLGVSDPDIADLDLKICGDAGILMLHRVGFYLLSRVPDLVGPDDLLALMAVEDIAGDHRPDGDRFALRRSLAQVSVPWFEEQALRLANNSHGRRRRILYWLIARAERAELRAIQEAVEPPPDPQEELWRGLTILDRARYDEVYTRPFGPGESPARFIELACEVVCDPYLPKPCKDRIVQIRKTLASMFRKVQLLAGSFASGEDVKFECMLPAIAAWAPEIGVRIIRQQIEGLPARPGDQPLWWAFRLGREAVLAQGRVRTALLQLLATPNPNDTERHALERILRALLPGLPPQKRIDALVDHPFGDFEWMGLYQLVANLIRADKIPYLLKRMRTTPDPLWRRRLRYLLSDIGYAQLTALDISILVDLIANGSEKDRWSALALAVACCVTSIPVEILLPLATKTTDQQSSIPRYAAQLLI